MLRQDSFTETNPNGTGHDIDNGYSNPSSKNAQGLELQQQLQRLEEIIVLDGFKVPLSGKTFIDEEQLLTQLLAVERSIPETVHAAERILSQRDDIIAGAKQYAQEIIKSAEQRAARIADQQTIIQQAEAEAQQLRHQIQQEVEELKRRNISDVERVRRQTQQDIDGMRQNALKERDQLLRESDQYADRVLTDLEKQLAEMMRVIKNGRMQLKPNQNQKQ